MLKQFKKKTGDIFNKKDRFHRYFIERIYPNPKSIYSTIFS